MSQPWCAGDGHGLSQQTPFARILAHEVAYCSCVASIEQRSHWVLVHNPAFSARIDANHAGFFRAPSGMGNAIAQDIIAFYESSGATPAAYVDALATPHDLIPCLLAAGFQEWTDAASDLLLYVGPDAERPAAHPVGPVTTSRERAAGPPSMTKPTRPRASKWCGSTPGKSRTRE